MSDFVETDVRRALPHLDRQWVEEAMLELRLRGVSGAAIGSALKEADSHLAASGTGTRETFGEPKAYAASLDLPDSQQFTPRELVILLGTTFLGIAAVFLIAAALFMSENGWARLSVASLGVLLGVYILVPLVLVRHGERTLRWLLEHAVLGTAAIGAVVVIGVGLAVLVRDVVVRIPQIPALGLGVVALLAAAALQLTNRRSGGVTDRIVFPPD